MSGRCSAPEIAAALEGRREGRQWRCRCPVHGGRSLSVSDGNHGRVLFYCHAGCKTSDVLAELRRCGIIERRSDDFRFTPRRNAGIAGARGSAYALALWSEARSACGTVVEIYLASRGLAAVPDRLRYHASCPHPAGGRHPAMLALVEHCRNGPVGVHRTYLGPSGSSKASLRPDRASLGPTGGGAARFAEVDPAKELIVAEGIETALSVAQSCDLPAWAALSAAGIRNLILPDDAHQVLICADHDLNGAGQRAAHAAAQRFFAEGRRVRLTMPPDPGTDFNDVLCAAASANTEEGGRVKG